MKLRLFDTAGLRDAENEAEKIGVEKTEGKLDEAQLILSVFDITENTVEIPGKIANAAAKKIAVFNKTDITDKRPKIPQGFDRAVYVSAKTGDGIETLENAIASLFPLSHEAESSEIPANLRQFECLSAAKNELQHAVENIGTTPDALLCDIEGAISALGEMTGKTVSEEIIENIFSRFCVGK